MGCCNSKILWLFKDVISLSREKKKSAGSQIQSYPELHGFIDMILSKLIQLALMQNCWTVQRFQI